MMKQINNVGAITTTGVMPSISPDLSRSTSFWCNSNIAYRQVTNADEHNVNQTNFLRLMCVECAVSRAHQNAKQKQTIHATTEHRPMLASPSTEQKATTIPHRDTVNAIERIVVKETCVGNDSSRED